MKIDDFFSTHNVFRYEEFAAFILKRKMNTKNSTIYNLLTYHQKKGHIRRIRRGLYCSIPRGVDADSHIVDPFLITSKLAPDAVIGYRTALYFFGKLHSIPNEFVYLSSKKEKDPFVYQGTLYRTVSIPGALIKSNQSGFGVKTIDHLGQKIRITSLERAAVDILDRPYLCGSWEEIWLSLENIEYLNLTEVFDYALLLGNATTIAKLGFYLETHKDELMVPDRYLNELRKYVPQTPHYLEKDKNSPQNLISAWNLIIPSSLIQREWEEPNENI